MQVTANISHRTGFKHLMGQSRGRSPPKHHVTPKHHVPPSSRQLKEEPRGVQCSSSIYGQPGGRAAATNPNLQHVSIQLHSGDARRVTVMGTKSGSVLVMRGILMLQGIVGTCCSGSRLCAASHHQPDTEMQRWVATSGKHCLGRDDGFRGNDIIKFG